MSLYGCHINSSKILLYLLPFCTICICGFCFLFNCPLLFLLLKPIYYCIFPKNIWQRIKDFPMWTIHTPCNQCLSDDVDVPNAEASNVFTIFLNRKTYFFNSFLKKMLKCCYSPKTIFDTCALFTIQNSELQCAT